MRAITEALQAPSNTCPTMRQISAVLLALLALPAVHVSVEAAPAASEAVVPAPPTAVNFVGVLYKGPGGRDYQIDHEGGRIGFGAHRQGD